VIIGGASGNGSQEAERLKALAKFLGIEDVVHFMPPISRIDLPELVPRI
jgi:hypothetical protein